MDAADAGRLDDDECDTRGDLMGPGNEDRSPVAADEEGSQSSSQYVHAGGSGSAAVALAEWAPRTTRSGARRCADTRTSAAQSSSGSDIECDPH